jgi:aspartate/methionine/tyrosine aminotransferase
MKIAPFATEHFFAQYEFTTPYQLCNSDCGPYSSGVKMAGVHWISSEICPWLHETLGNPQLWDKIAGSYKGINTADVVVLRTLSGIYLVAQAGLNPGDDVIVISPAYDALVNVFEHVVGPSHVRKWEFIPGDRRWELDFDRLTGLISPQTKMLVVNFPHNPTGFLPGQDQLNQLAQFVEQNNLILFCDEMYYGLVHSGTPGISSAAEITKRAVVLSGLSKTYGLPGLRTGWLVIQDDELRQNIINWKFIRASVSSAIRVLSNGCMEMRSLREEA